MTTPSLRSRVLLIDLLKACAAQLIILHHFSWYGLIVDPANTAYAGLASGIDWLAEYGRYAVAVFIAAGGFLAAQTLPMHGLPARESVFGLIRERYFRLVLPFAVLLLVEVVFDTLARQWMTHEGLDSPPEFLQFLSHVFLLHTLLGIESLSAGVWYVAIDFQLYALLVLLLWIGQRIAPQARLAGALLVLAIGLASLFYFNRDPRWDALALYFFGSYALGVVSGWAIRSEWRKPMLWGIALVGALALAIDFRGRIALALAVALALGSSRLRMAHREVQVVHYLGNTSYALFLVHFPVYELVAALFHHFDPAAEHRLIGFAVAWAASLLIADLFHRWVELPLLRWRKRLRIAETKVMK